MNGDSISDRRLRPVVVSRYRVGLTGEHVHIKIIRQAFTQRCEQLSGRFRIRPVGPIQKQDTGSGRRTQNFSFSCRDRDGPRGLRPPG